MTRNAMSRGPTPILAHPLLALHLADDNPRSKLPSNEESSSTDCISQCS